MEIPNVKPMLKLVVNAILVAAWPAYSCDWHSRSTSDSRESDRGNSKVNARLDGETCQPKLTPNGIVEKLQRGGVDVHISRPLLRPNDPPRVNGLCLDKDDLRPGIFALLKRFDEQYKDYHLEIISDVHHTNDLQFLKELKGVSSLRIVGKQFDTGWFEYVKNCDRIDTLTLEFLKVRSNDLKGIRNIRDLSQLFFYAVKFDRADFAILDDIGFKGRISIHTSELTDRAKQYLKAEKHTFEYFSIGSDLDER